MMKWKELIKNVAKEQKVTLPEVEKVDNGMTYPELFSYITMASGLNNTHRIVRNMISCYNTPNEKNMMVREYARHHEIPILTTNYDDYLDYEPKLRSRWRKNVSQNIKYIEEFYTSPHKGVKPFDDAAVWHINGHVQYPLSMRLSFTDYCNQIVHLTRMIPLQKELQDGRIDAKKKKAFEHSWLEIFFRKKLCIVGLGLGKDEIVLRWLLLRRKVLWNRLVGSKDKTTGWYCYSLKTEMKLSESIENKEEIQGKKMLLNSLGIVPVEFPTIEELYEQIFKSERK